MLESFFYFSQTGENPTRQRYLSDSGVSVASAVSLSSESTEDEMEKKSKVKVPTFLKIIKKS